MRIACILLAVACAQAPDEPVLITDAEPVIEVVCSELDEAARLAGSGEREAARQAWSRAHDAFDAELEPWIRAHHGDRSALELDYAMGQLRVEMGKRRGRPRDKAAALAKSLRGLPKPASPPPSGV